MPLVCALAAGMLIFIMALTGVMLRYEKQMLAWSDRRTASVVVPQESARRVAPTTLIAAVRAISR